MTKCLATESEPQEINNAHKYVYLQHHTCSCHNPQQCQMLQVPISTTVCDGCESHTSQAIMVFHRQPETESVSKGEKEEDKAVGYRELNVNKPAICMRSVD